MPYPLRSKVSVRNTYKRTYPLFRFPKQEKSYLYILAALFLICGCIYPYPNIAMWVAFGLSAFSAISNDSIQTIGTFLSSNIRKVKWYYLWLFMGGTFVLTILYSWVTFGGDISYQRLQSKGLDEAPTAFTFLQLIAPLILLILTRMRMPVSTSILLLSAFSTHSLTLGKILAKSFVGYWIAFIVAIILWYAITYISWKYFRKASKKPAASWWYPTQWVVSGTLWAIWIMHDMSNIAVVLPRSLSLMEFIVVASYVFFGLGLIFYMKGDKIQQVIAEKTNTHDIRVATVIDLSYLLILYYLQNINKLPISTTWVFIGLLGGRELGIGLCGKNGKFFKKRYNYAIAQITKDALRAGIGLFVSLLLAIGVNKELREEVLKFFP